MKKINLEEVKKKEDLFLKKLDEEIELKKSGITPTQQFLKSIEESLKKGIDNKLSFSQISKIIFATFSVKVSTQTLRAYAHTNLGYSKDKTEKKEVIKQAIKDEKIVVEKVENKPALSIEDMKKIQSSNLNKDDTDIM